MTAPGSDPRSTEDLGHKNALQGRNVPKTVTFCFVDGTDQHKDKVRTAVREWLLHVGIDFVESSDARASDLRITFTPEASCRPLQSQRLEAATMNLSYIPTEVGELVSTEKTSILHEFGPMLGMLHDLQTPTQGESAMLDIKATLEWYRGESAKPVDEELTRDVRETYGLDL